MFTDLSGFSRRVSEFGIIHFLQVIHEQRKLLLPIVESFDGLLLKQEGDSFLIMFRTAERAVACGVAMQHACSNVNERRKPEEQILLCLGIGYGRILRIGDEDVWGREVTAPASSGRTPPSPTRSCSRGGAGGVGRKSRLRLRGHRRRLFWWGSELPPDVRVRRVLLATLVGALWLRSGLHGS